MSFDDIVKFVEHRFQLPAVKEITSNMMLIKVNGLDNYSLAKYIYDNVDKVKVSVKEKEGYKFNNLGWVKVEISNENLFVQTKDICGC